MATSRRSGTSTWRVVSTSCSQSLSCISSHFVSIVRANDWFLIAARVARTQIQERDTRANRDIRRGYSPKIEVTTHTRDVGATSRCVADTDDEEDDSPENAALSSADCRSILDLDTDEFRYQRIEGAHVFGDYVKAISFQLMSRIFCRSNELYRSFENDPNNRHALSRGLQGFYDGTSALIPLVKITGGSVSPIPLPNGRYAVNLLLTTVSSQYGQRIAELMKEGTSVGRFSRVANSSLRREHSDFCECLEWRAEETSDHWKAFFNSSG